jgi:hypothetical protein
MAHSGGRNMKNKLFSISLIFIFFVVLATVASAAQVTKIGSGLQPAIAGSKVTWSQLFPFWIKTLAREG